MGCCKCEEYGWDDPGDGDYLGSDGKLYCFYHAPENQKEMSVEEFNERIFEKIRKSEIYVQLSGVVYPGDIDFSWAAGAGFPKHYDFSFSVFLGDVSFEGFHFGDTIYCRESKFKGDVIFNETELSILDFDKSSFARDVNFNDVTINNYATFVNVVFAEYCCFYSSFFHKVFFISTIFNNLVEFVGMTFIKNAVFESVEFNKLLIVSSNIEKSVSISKPTLFENGANFSNAKIEKGLIDNVRVVDGVFNMNSVHIENKGLKVKNCDLNRFSFLDSDVESIEFSNVTWRKKYGNKGRYQHILEEDSAELQRYRDFYQRMKRKYKDEHNEYEASKWHASEKELQLKILKKNEESRVLALFLSLYKQSSGFGESPVRAGWVLCVLMILPLLVLASASLIDAFSWFSFDGRKVDGVIKSWLYYIPLAKVSKADGIPGWQLALMSLSQLAISIQAALFGFALRNRFRR